MRAEGLVMLPAAARQEVTYEVNLGGKASTETASSYPSFSSNRGTEGGTHMKRNSVLMRLGLGAMLVVGVGSWGMASAAPRATIQMYTGQVREIKIDQCGLQPGTCEGSLVLQQSGGQEVALAIPPGTWIQRGDQRVHLDEVGIGNYVRAQAAPLPTEVGNLPRDGNGKVGTSMGERPLTFYEANEP
jgi:hypothetical protein